MKKKYIAPQVKEIKIQLQGTVLAGSDITVPSHDEPGTGEDLSKEDYEEWDFDW